MWRLSLRDLQWRRRRFLIAVFATAIVFSMTLLMSGITAGMRAENRRIVERFHADAWLVAKGTSGPFTASTVIPAAVATQVATTPGVRRADPIVLFRSTVGKETLKDVNIIGYQLGGIGAPRPSEGRAPRARGDVVADTALGVGVGDRISVSGHSLRVVGLVSGVTYYFGTPTLLMSVQDAQDLAFTGQPLATAIVTRGVPARVPAGLSVVSEAHAISDLARSMKSSDQTLALINGLLWIVAAGIIGSIIYLSALERLRDFAVLKATGASNRALLAGLALQALVLAVASALLAVVIARLLGPMFPFTVTIPGSALVGLGVVAVVVGLVASLAGLRRAVHVDPALAFGGA